MPDPERITDRFAHEFAVLKQTALAKRAPATEPAAAPQAGDPQTPGPRPLQQPAAPVAETAAPEPAPVKRTRRRKSTAPAGAAMLPEAEVAAPHNGEATLSAQRLLWGCRMTPRRLPHRNERCAGSFSCRRRLSSRSARRRRRQPRSAASLVARTEQLSCPLGGRLATLRPYLSDSLTCKYDTDQAPCARPVWSSTPGRLDIDVATATITTRTTSVGYAGSVALFPTRPYNW